MLKILFCLTLVQWSLSGIVYYIALSNIPQAYSVLLMAGGIIFELIGILLTIRGLLGIEIRENTRSADSYVYNSEGSTNSYSSVLYQAEYSDPSLLYYCLGVVLHMIGTILELLSLRM